MYSFLLSEGGSEGGIGWMVWVALAIFFVMVFLGWLAASKGWLKKQEDLVQVGHGHEEHGHGDHGHAEPAPEVSEQIETTHAEPESIPEVHEPVGATDAEPESAAEVLEQPHGPDRLTTLEGIGPKVEKILHELGITTFAGLANVDVAKLKDALAVAGYKYMDPTGWIEQAELAARGDTEGLKKLQATLKGGRKVG